MSQRTRRPPSSARSDVEDGAGGQARAGSAVRRRHGRRGSARLGRYPVPVHGANWPGATFIINITGAARLAYFATRLQERLPQSTPTDGRFLAPDSAALTRPFPRLRSRSSRCSTTTATAWRSAMPPPASPPAIARSGPPRRSSDARGWYELLGMGSDSRTSRGRSGDPVPDRRVDRPAVRPQLPSGTLSIPQRRVPSRTLTGLALEGNALLLAGTATLGSYTPFSTWMLETHRLGEDGDMRAAGLNVVVGVSAATIRVHI